jgi:hypothetical protein
VCDCRAQDTIDGLLAALGSSTTDVTEGAAGSGSRAEQAVHIPESEWEAARHLSRAQLPQLLTRVRAAAREGTQLACLLREDYATFHQRWPFVGLYRADGTLDASQVRAVAASDIKGRGFSFPEYVAVMSHFYAAEALAKWSTKQLWREELVALWNKATAPHYPWQPKPPSPKATRLPRGRAGDHAALLERVSALLLEYRAGVDAIVRIADLAQAIGCHRRTISAILDELRAAGQVQTRRLGRYGGLLVTFAAAIAEQAPPARTSESALPTSDPDTSLAQPDVSFSLVPHTEAPALLSETPANTFRQGSWELYSSGKKGV